MRAFAWFTFSISIVSLNLKIFQATKNKISVCYYRNWSQWEESPYARFFPENIDPKLCSVVNYSHMMINLKTHKLEPKQKNDGNMLRRLNILKKDNPDLILLASVGGPTHENQLRFSSMVRNYRTRYVFINSVIVYLIRHRLDGINLDWEYPTQRGSPPEDKKRFSHLLKEIKRTFHWFRYIKRFYLTLSVSASPERIESCYEVRKAAKYVDWVDVMAYNLRTPKRRRTGCPSLMIGDEPTVPQSIYIWLQKGMPASKVNLGLASYGKTFNLRDPRRHFIEDRATGEARYEGYYTRKRGILSYYEICSRKWELKTQWYESSCGTPFASTKRVWVAYEDPESIQHKVRTLVNRLGLKGISFWALDFDDFKGKYCGFGKYPLLKAAVSEMNKPCSRRINRQLPVLINPIDTQKVFV